MSKTKQMGHRNARLEVLHKTPASLARLGATDMTTMCDIETIRVALLLAKRFSKAQQDKDEFQRLASMSWCIAQFPSGQEQQRVANLDEIKSALVRAIEIVPKGKQQIRDAITATTRMIAE